MIYIGINGMCKTGRFRDCCGSVVTLWRHGHGVAFCSTPALATLVLWYSTELLVCVFLCFYVIDTGSTGSWARHSRGELGCTHIYPSL
jgi:hypothetical protein